MLFCTDADGRNVVLAQESQNKGSSTSFLRSPVANEERERSMGDFLWLGSVLEFCIAL